jgi:hypothetical protein
MKRNIENINPLSKETDKRLKSYGIDSDSDESHEIIKQHSSEQNKVLSTSTASDNQNTLTDQTNFVLPQSTTIEEQDIIDPQVRLGELLHNSLEELQTFVEQHRDSLDLNKSNLWGNPPIVVAAKRPNAILPTVQFLLEQGANPNGVDKKGNTFLHHLLINKHAVSKITPPFLELAIKKGFNLYLENKEGYTAFDIAKNKNLNQDLKAILNLLEVSEIIEEPLIEEESIEEEPDIINPQIKLGKFLPRAPIKEVQTFVEQHKDSLDLNKPNQDDNPPIVVAAKRISAILPTVQFLLEQGVNPNGVDKKGNTFLHHLLNNNRAFSKITPSFLELAIKKGFNLYLENKEGYTAFDIAKSKDMNNSLLELLQGESIENDINQESVTYDNPTSQQDDQKVTNTNKGALSFICQQQDDYTIPSIGDDGFSDYVV